MRRGKRVGGRSRKGSPAEENARLRQALARERARRRALEKTLGAAPPQGPEAPAVADTREQAATAEILRLISTSPGDAQPVFDGIARYALSLCDAEGATAVRYDGALLHLAAHHNVSPDAVARLQGMYPRVPDLNSPLGRAVLEGVVVHVPDLQAVDLAPSVAREFGRRGHVSIPLLHQGRAIGAIGLSRMAAGPFSERQLALLQTFAEQAVVAIENARLFNEAKEALERQAATAEVLRVIGSSPTDAQPVFDAIASTALRVGGATGCAVLMVEGDMVHLVAASALTPAWVETARTLYPNAVSAAALSSRVIRERRIIHLTDIEHHPETTSGAIRLARTMGYRTVLMLPILHRDSVVGVITAARQAPTPFPPRQVELLQTFADQAVIAIENVRLFRELEARNAELTESLARQTATAEILRVISSSPTDVQPVFDAIVESARRLLGGISAMVTRVVGEALNLGALTTTDERSDALLRATFPRSLHDESLPARAIRDRAPHFIADTETDARSTRRDVSRARGFRSYLSVPMLREGTAIGAINVTRPNPGAFTPAEIGLLQTFAGQAVIAIENVRLFTELENRNKALTEAHAQVTEALEQQTATSEILRVISQSPTEVQPVFDAIVRSCASLCHASDVIIVIGDGDSLRIAASIGPVAASVQRSALFRGGGLPLTRGSVSGRAFIDQRTVHVQDVGAMPDEFPEGRTLQREYGGHGTTLAVPLLREDVALGVITLLRNEVSAFTDRQVALLRTFADQAVIAIENARLFAELQESNRDLTESLEQQTATAEILRLIGISPTDAQPVFEGIARSGVKVLGSLGCTVFLIEQDVLRVVATHGVRPERLERLRTQFPAALSSLPEFVRTVREGIFHLGDIEHNPKATPADVESAHLGGYRTRLMAPMMRGDSPLGIIVVTRETPEPFSDRQVELLKTFAGQAVIAIENVRLFTELEARNRDLGVSLERQTATADILRAISQAQTDVQPVFEAIAESVMRLFAARSALVFRYDGEFLRLAAERGDPTTKRGAMIAWLRSPRRPETDWASGRAILTRSVQQIADVETDDHVGPGVRQLARERGWRSTVVVPMLRGTDVLGTVSVSRVEPGAFSAAEIELLKTFADQAVIAVENARLLTELQARTADLQRSVGQLTALGEVGQAVSSSLDLETVLTTIVSRAVQLSGLDGGVVFEYDEAAETFVQRAATQSQALVAAGRVGLRKGEGVVGRTAITLEPVQVPDIAVAGAYAGRARTGLIESGVRALLAVPIVREGRLLGGLAVSRNRPGEFPAETVDLLRTFAAQSALAIQNARLFQQLEAANRHKSAFLASMSHELRTPLNAIIGYSEMLQEEATDAGQPGLVPDLGKITVAGKYLLELINTVLDLSKIEAGRMDLYLETFAVPALLEEIVAVVQPLAERRDNRLVLACAPDVGEMHADLTKVRQTLFNLLSNACKFTEKGTVTLSARVAAPVGSAAWLVFDVADTGIGMTDEQVGRLFAEFSQAEASTARRYGGTGLGLALSRRLCRLMGGEITVATEWGRGSTFTVRLPREVAEAQPASDSGAPVPADGADRTVESA